MVREASFTPPARAADRPCPRSRDFTDDLLALLRHWDVCSKEWIVRQYDHEVQARTVIKPLVGEHDDGPGDASVVLPVRGSTRGLAVACGINPRVRRRSTRTRWRPASSTRRSATAWPSVPIPSRIALLDNFCWGNTERPETLGSLVLAAEACHDLALAYKTPFISGQGQPEQRIHARGPKPGHPADPVDQRDRAAFPTSAAA